MIKNELINGYKILKDGVMNGMCTWTFAYKGEKEYFIKEFLSPVYPTSDAPGSAKFKEKKKELCDLFEKHQREIVNTLKKKCSIGGNLIFAIDFFRNGTKYYKVTEKIEVASIPTSEISTLDIKKRILIMTTVAFSLKILHDVNLVHGDLKPDNILIKKIDSSLKSAEDSYTTKLIDFDSSFFNMKPPKISEEVVGDIAYYSPELFRYIKNDSRTLREDLTTKSDVFALGLIFCKYLTNKFPHFDKEKYKFISVAANNGETIKIDKGDYPPGIEELVNSMLYLRHEDRPEIKDVHLKLKSLLSSTKSSEISITEEEPKGTPISKPGLIIFGTPKPKTSLIEPKSDITAPSRVKFGKGLKK